MANNGDDIANGGTDILLDARSNNRNIGSVIINCAIVVGVQATTIKISHSYSCHPFSGG